ncbi:MAG: hypothetical protein FWD84_06125, partial [Oscillospiraceae bacterium]|nr:hypothetical protein [Oscillospiraceae bacterium]
MLRTVTIHLHVLTLLTLAVMAFIILTRLKNTKREFFVLFLLCGFLYVLGTLSELMAISVDSFMLGRRVMVLGGQLSAPMFLVFTQHYCERRLPKPVNVIIFLTAFFLILSVWSVGLHDLIYTSIYLSPASESGLASWTLTYGPLIPLTTILPAVCMTLSILLLISKALRSNTAQRKRLVILIFCALIPGISAALPLLNCEVLGIYSNMFLIALASVVVYFGLFKYDLLENDETLRSQKMMREMIANISHDLKTPLTVLSVNL